jgi:hypothetical protein
LKNEESVDFDLDSQWPFNEPSGFTSIDRQKSLYWTKFGTAALGAGVPSSLKSVHRATSLAQNWT